MYVYVPQNDECGDCKKHGKQRKRYAHVADDLQGELDLMGDFKWCCAQQDGKVSEVVALTHRHGGVGKVGVFVAPSARPIPFTEDAISGATYIRTYVRTSKM